MAHGAWRMAHGAWRMAHGAWRMAHGVNQQCILPTGQKMKVHALVFYENLVRQHSKHTWPGLRIEHLNPSVKRGSCKSCMYMNFFQ